MFPELGLKLNRRRLWTSGQFCAIIVGFSGITALIVGHSEKERAKTTRPLHALRHPGISALANAGVAADIRQKLAGHASSKAHVGYTHHEIETLRGAIEKLPTLAVK